MTGISASERRSRKNHAILQAMGGEPTWNPSQDDSQLVHILNWYSQNKDSSDAQKYFVEYFKRQGKPENELKIVSVLPAWEIGSHGWLARMALLSPSFPVQYLDKLDEKYSVLITRQVKQAVDDIAHKKEKPNIQDRLEEKFRDYVGEVEAWLDDFFANNFSSTISPLQFFQDNKLLFVQAKRLADHYRRKNLNELTLALTGQDEQLVEAYAHLGKSGIKKTISFLELIINDAEKWYIIAKKISVDGRKPRIRKSKPAIKQIAKLKYLREHEQFKSINPTEIVGAEQLWVYNVKYRTLGLYVCQNSHGFMVKGCTILNFEESQSVCKKLRKPEQILPKTLEAGKVALRKLLPSIRAKEKKLTGRINKDTILLRAL